MDRVAPESMDNSAMFPFLNTRNQNERNIVMAHPKTLACKIANCPNTKIIGFGYCNAHYLKLKRYGDPLYVHKICHIEKFCTIEGCNNKTRCMGLCNKHYCKTRYAKEMESAERRRLINNGWTKMPEYGIWAHIKERCTNPKVKCWDNYGGRGIKVCDRWLNNFDNFYADMGKRPSPEYQIDRIDNNGNYEPNNCHWALHIDNARNKRTTLTEHQVRDIRKHIYMGLMNLEIESITGVNRGKISNIKRGHSYKNYGLLKH